MILYLNFEETADKERDYLRTNILYYRLKSIHSLKELKLFFSSVRIQGNAKEAITPRPQNFKT